MSTLISTYVIILPSYGRSSLADVELALATFMTPFAVFKNECSYNCASCALLNILLKNLISYYTRDKQFIDDEKLQKGA
ncbi:hypothetical protein [Wolbachia endosymbiont (group A) of Anomoia purmunda]|uniref:hypothetical protein n=1 Tax=Wolbachia endosymbiont (group A) of Anomoia purmunda TaxID=2953978 RepID=UPI00222E9E29|nr:hypothetical protein [Wolbachia endosymbiont (group A) of Anomoia purmunda]